MKFIKVEEIPERRIYHSLKNDWEEFMSMNVKVAKVDMTQYKYTSISVARCCMYRSVRAHGYPIDIRQRGDEIYLVRRDM